MLGSDTPVGTQGPLTCRTVSYSERDRRPHVGPSGLTRRASSRRRLAGRFSIHCAASPRSMASASPWHASSTIPQRRWASARSPHAGVEQRGQGGHGQSSELSSCPRSASSFRAASLRAWLLRWYSKEVRERDSSMRSDLVVGDLVLVEQADQVGARDIEQVSGLLSP